MLNEGVRGEGQLYSVHDSKTGLTYQYSYDSQGRLMSSSVKNASGNVVTTRQAYDANNQLTAQYWQLGSTNYSETYTYSKTTGLLATHKPAVGNTLSFTYDALQRLSTVTGGIYGKTYTYRDITGTDKSTTQVSQLTYDLPTDITYGYTYDALGNIATYNEAGTTYTYTYDAQNQLTSVKTNGTVTHTYEYDAVGNIKKAINATRTHTYTYDNGVWKDLLTEYDGHTITYDDSGNPTTYYNGNEWDMVWTEGSRLTEASDGTTSLDFTYDSDGLRLTKKVNNSTTYHYYYAGGKLLRQTGGGNTLDFFYDASGNPYALKYNNTLYYYITNLQGDVTKIVNTSGTPVVSYSYSPYGAIESVTDTSGINLGTVNPLRYRGYVYDEETKLYYLQSRYYDPTTCRFINADSYASTGQGVIGCNMFAYCLNNPTSMADTNGNIPFFIVTAIAGMLIGGIIGYATTGSWEAALAGVAIGGIIGLAGGAVAANLLAGSAIAETGMVVSSGMALLGVGVPEILRKADEIAQQVGSLYRKFTYKNFRYNLQQFTGSLGKGMQAHHVFPEKFAEVFAKFGINIHNPLFGSWVDSNHQKWSNAYNNAWQAFFDTVKNPSVSQIFEKAAELAQQFGFEIYFK